MSHLIDPGTNTLEAMLALHGNAYFSNVFNWLRTCLVVIRAKNDTLSDRELAWSQGAAQVLAEFVALNSSAFERLEKVRERERKKELRKGG